MTILLFWFAINIWPVKKNFKNVFINSFFYCKYFHIFSPLCNTPSSKAPYSHFESLLKKNTLRLKENDHYPDPLGRCWHGHYITRNFMGPKGAYSGGSQQFRIRQVILVYEEICRSEKSYGLWLWLKNSKYSTYFFLSFYKAEDI